MFLAINFQFSVISGIQTDPLVWWTQWSQVVEDEIRKKRKKQTKKAIELDIIGKPWFVSHTKHMQWKNKRIYFIRN